MSGKKKGAAKTAFGKIKYAKSTENNNLDDPQILMGPF